MDSSNGGSRSGSSTRGDESADSRSGMKQYHRHSPSQIRELEAFFKEIPHPDEKQRMQLSRELGLHPKQIKFWFQNKRTQKKAQNEKADNNALRAENERIKRENSAIREALKNIVCPACQGTAIIQDQDQQGLLRLMSETSRLRQQHEMTTNLFDTKKPHTAHQPGIQNFPSVAGNNFPCEGMVPMASLDAEQIPQDPENLASPCRLTGLQEMDKSMIVDAATAAVDELVELLRLNDPVWISSPSEGRCTLHRDSYDKLFPKPSHFKSASARMESSKDSGEVAMRAAQLVEMFLDPIKWKGMFPNIVTKASTIQVVETGSFLSGSLQLMYEKTHILSPLVAPRDFFLIRYIHQLNPTTWVMVDVSYDFIKQLQETAPTRSWKLPSGCMIEDKSNGKSFITWIEHVQVDDKSLTHPRYRDLICGSQAYGAKRWIITLQRMCDRFAFSLRLNPTPKHDLEGVINLIEGRKNLMMLSHRMLRSFYETLSMSDGLDFPHLSEMNNSGVRVALRKSNGTGQPLGLIVGAATSLWLPFSHENIFEFFKDNTKRAQWDILAGGNPVSAIAHISTGIDAGNGISIIQPFVPKENLLMLQESGIDPLGGFMVYTPIDLPSITSVLNGCDAMTTQILPSGYVISTDARPNKGIDGSSSSSTTCGSLMTIAFQILACSGSASKQLSMESVATVHTLISSTVQKIKEALGCPELD